jgi:hypothetical protein
MKRRQYFENIDTHLIEQQLCGPPQFEVDEDDEQEVYFGFNERTRLATSLFPIESDMNSICHSRRQEERAKPRACYCLFLCESE